MWHAGCFEATMALDHPQPHVAGIGASAGGLEALERFFDHVPMDSGVAFVVVQHLSPDFKSLMDEILSRRTKLPIALVEDGMLVQPNHVYLIPAKKEMIISGGRLLLSEKERNQDLSLPIDVFFRSLAQDCGRRGIAIVLSGGGSDGSRGIRAVHEAGGLVLVQDTETAQFDGMPRTARDAGVADHVLAPEDMPKLVTEYAKSTTRRSELAGDEGGQGMSTVYRMLEKEFGIDFTHYKPSTVTRRIDRRLALARVEDVGEYVERLKADREELDVLYRDLLIGVTRFFRNEEAFAALEQHIFPELLSRAEGAPLRLWVAGCATGEEVYSLAILLHELMQRHGERAVKIFATDAHATSIEVATRGLYDEEAVSNVSPERLERYFMRKGRSYQVIPDIRQMAVFAVHNVIKDAPFTRVDFVSCRNMLIYLQPPVQQKVLSLFHFALNRGGVLLLGPSESPGLLSHDFETLDKRWRLYRKYSDSRTSVSTKLAGPSPLTPGRPTSAAFSAAAAQPRTSSSELLATYDALLEDFIPPSLLVNDRSELVHVFGGANRFLRVPVGRQGLDVLDMVEPDLRTVLLGSITRAMKQTTPLVFRGVRATASGPLHKVTLRRVQGKGRPRPHVLISFQELDGETRTTLPVAETELDMRQVSRDQLSALEAELVHTKENLQAATEELETSNEELQAANEELLASNEELQSTNEELQSVNEELYTVNAEYQRKISDLTELGNDMENLFASTDVGTIFLDRELRIRKFTAQVADTFNLMPGDIGRPIAAFSNTMNYPQLTEDLKRVLETGRPIEHEVKSGNERAGFLRILPYRAKGSIDGVVLTLLDLSGLKAAEDALFHERYLLNSLLSSVPDAIYFKDARGRFIRANMPMAARLGLTDAREAEGKTGFELPGHEAALAVHQQDEVVLRTGEAQHYNIEKRTDADGKVHWDMVTRLPLNDDAGNVVGIIGIFRNVTAEKSAEEATREGVRRRDQFLAMLSHELRNPLGAVVAATELLKTATREEKRATLLQILERQSRQMARLLDDLLDVSRVTQDKIKLRRRPMDLLAVVKEAVEAVRGLMDSRELSFTAQLPAGPLWVQGDPARLQQVHANLLNNAAKYTPRGGRVALEVASKDGEAIIAVRDDGVGIPAPLLDTVFELFVQSSRTLERSDGGLGVGLTLVRKLVHMHDGSVTAHSEGEGKGSEFVVRLPLVEPPRESERPVQRSSVAPARPLRVVIIEDNADSRVMICELLELAGFQCQTAEDGLEGLKIIEESAPDVAIVDIGLPGIDGFEVARRVRRHPKNARVLLLALTGYGQHQDAEQAFQAGFDRHLVKPVDPAVLMRVLNERARELDPA
jgi:two-component system CheB/CheR fusion protein